jgi:uncharacterized protein YprB with RNaseH-like and TPR domain
MDSLRQRLDQLTRIAARPPAGAPARSAQPALSSLQVVLGGTEVHSPRGPLWEIVCQIDRRHYDHALTRESFSRTLHVPGKGGVAERIVPREAAVIDIETGGFAGCPVFLIGIMRLDTWPLRTEQWLARDYPEEAAILARFAQRAGSLTAWVTFNGRSFDEPFLRDRGMMYRLAVPLPRVHFDVLHAARRAWGRRGSDCRLETLERRILGRTRVGDVAGRDVPDLFHHFMRTGNAAPLRPVLEHNRRDLLASAELLAALCGRRGE